MFVLRSVLIIIALFGLLIFLGSIFVFLKNGVWPHANLDEVAIYFIPDLEEWVGVLLIFSYIPVWSFCLILGLWGWLSSYE